MMTLGSEQQMSVPPGFRFHPTEEELVYYYLRKKVSYEPIDLDVIRDIDLNKLEPWDLKDKCRIGSGSQNDWYFFSHKDKKYPTGTRTNRATMAGFWKATGRDKAIHLSCSKRIGMRKTLVFYTGRAPHGQKTEWIMHEYRLDDENAAEIQQEDGWVVCRVFKKKNHPRSGFHPEIDQEDPLVPFNPVSKGCTFESPNNQNSDHHQSRYNNYTTFNHHPHHNSMHLPQLMTPESTLPSSYLSSLPLTNIDQQNFLRLTSERAGTSAAGIMLPEKLSGDWLFLEKLLATHPTVDQMGKFHGQFSQVADLGVQRSLFPYHHGFEPDFSKYSK